MFDMNAYRKECDRLTLSRDTLEEMITMTKQKKVKALKPLRVAVLAAALMVALCLTAAATEGPIKDMIEEFIITYTFTEKGDSEFGMSVNGEMDMRTGLVLSTMAYAERDGRKFLTLDGEEIDVTEAMAKDGYYERELEGCLLRVDETGMATITVYNEDGEVDMSYAVGLTEEGPVSSTFDFTSRWEGIVDENGNIASIGDEIYEVRDTYHISEEDGEVVLRDKDGNRIDFPQE